MWRNTGQPVRLLMLDAGPACRFFGDGLLELVHALHRHHRGRLLLGDLFFGLTLPAMVRLARRWLVGPVRTAVPVWNRRRLA